MYFINLQLTIVSSGYDCEPFRFRGSVSEGWQLLGPLDTTKSRSSSIRESSARDLFKQMDLKGKSASAAGSGDDMSLRTIHQNTITTIRAYEGSASEGGVKVVSSGGVDGRIVLFPVGMKRPGM